MSTSTLSFCWSGLTSTISPSTSESGPDVTLTDSPSPKAATARGRSALGGAGSGGGPRGEAGRGVKDPVRLRLGQGHRLRARADEPGDAGGVLHHRPGL